MSSLHTAVELPATRSSRTFHRKNNIHDPNWIPVLHGPSTPQSEISTPYFDALPQFPSRASSRPTTPRGAGDVTRDKARSVAPSELEGAPIPVGSGFRSLGLSSSNPPSLRHTSSSDDTQTLRSCGHTTSTGAASTVGTQSLLEDQVYTIPGNSMPKDDLVFPPIPLSTRSSMSSVKRPPVPISKYSRKPVSRLLDTATAQSTSLPPSQPQTPHDSSDMQFTRSMERLPSMGQYTSHDSPRLRSAPSSEHVAMVVDQIPYQSTQLRSPPSIEHVSIQHQQYPVAPPIPQELPTSTGRLSHAKSSASERKARALHSHPSNHSMRSEHSPSGSTHSFATTPVPRQRRLTDSRKSSIHELPPPTAAPQEPLPDLPPEARRPPTRERPLPTKSQSQAYAQVTAPTNAHVPSHTSKSLSQTFQHKELAEFMTRKNTVIFRRFDDVHVRLLLNLQDQITSLEKELAELERPGRGDQDRDGQSVKVMAETRRLLAEYDHLFSNWKLMQASPADKQVKEDLESWLQKPPNEGQGLSIDAREDLAWVKESGDLSSVAVGSRQQKEKFKPEPVETTNVTGKRKGDGGKTGFAALFSCCAGKRK